jgi:uncharacterized protein HemX
MLPAARRRGARHQGTAAQAAEDRGGAAMLRIVALLLVLSLSTLALCGCATQTQLGGRQMGFSMNWNNPNHP